MCGADLQAFPMDRQRQAGQQAFAVAGIDLDDRRPARCLVGDDDRRGDLECGAAARERGRGGGRWHWLRTERRLDRLHQPPSQPPVGIGSPLRILHQQVVERHAVACGVDAGVDNRRAGAGQPGADPVEQARPVGREDTDPCGARFGFVGRNDMRAGGAEMRLGFRHLPGVGDLPGRGLGQPVAVGQAARMGAGGAGLPAEHLCKGLLALGYFLGSPALLVA